VRRLVANRPDLTGVQHLYVNSWWSTTTFQCLQAKFTLETCLKAVFAFGTHTRVLIEIVVAQLDLRLTPWTMRKLLSSTTMSRTYGFIISRYSNIDQSGPPSILHMMGPVRGLGGFRLFDLRAQNVRSQNAGPATFPTTTCWCHAICARLVTAHRRGPCWQHIVRRHIACT
jgi:hypothetical protein